jgi:hypothetical protein
MVVRDPARRAVSLSRAGSERNQVLLKMSYEDSTAFGKTFAMFARIWSAVMIPIIEKSGGWPGFRYTAEEQAEMRDQVGRFPNASARVFGFAFVNAPIAIALLLIPITVMLWILTTLEGVHGQFPSATVFFAIFGTTMAIALSVILPLSLYLTCTFFRNSSWNSDLTARDSQFGRRLFRKFCLQTARVAFIASIGLFLLSLWPEHESGGATTQTTASKPFGFWERSLLPLGSSAINLLTLLYYYGRESRPRPR